MIFSPTGSLRQEVSAPGIPGAGIALFNEVCARDLEGIVAKRIEDPYADRVWWVKVKNPAYTRAVGRGGAVWVAAVVGPHPRDRIDVHLLAVGRLARYQLGRWA